MKEVFSNLSYDRSRVNFGNESLMKVVGRNEWTDIRMVLRELSKCRKKDRGTPNYLAWSDEDVLRRELENARFSDIRIERIKKRFLLGSKSDAVRVWRDMASSFPTLRFVLEEVFSHPKIASASSGGDSSERRSKFERSVAEAFATILKSRGAPPGANCFGYLDGGAIFGIGTK